MMWQRMLLLKTLACLDKIIRKIVKSLTLSEMSRFR